MFGKRQESEEFFHRSLSSPSEMWQTGCLSNIIPFYILRFHSDKIVFEISWLLLMPTRDLFKHLCEVSRAYGKAWSESRACPATVNYTVVGCYILYTMVLLKQSTSKSWMCFCWEANCSRHWRRRCCTCLYYSDAEGLSTSLFKVQQN